MAWRSAPAFFLLVCLTHAARGPGREEVRFRHAQPTPQPAAALITYKLVRSSVECAKLCTSHFRCQCGSYGYSRKSRHCLLYSEGSLAGAASTSADWIFYSAAYHKVYGIPCTGNDTCDTACNFECREGECTCVAGYHYHPARDTCLATCPGGYGDGYYRVYAECLQDNNEDSKFEDGLTLEQCWEFCRSDPQCRTFEHRTGQCHKSYTTKLEQPGAWKRCISPTAMNYYQRHCA